MAKKKTATKLTVESGPKKKRGLAAHRHKSRKRALTATPRSNPSANPPAAADLVNVILPGFAAYGATRGLARIVYSLVQKRWPRFAKHAYAAAGLASFGGAWLLAHRVERLAKYHDSVLMGTGVAALQGVAGTYLPKKYRWLLVEPQADVAVLPARAAAPALPEPTGDDDDGLDAIAGAENRAFELKLRKLERAAARQTPRASAPVDDDGDDDDLSQVLDDGDDELHTGVFASN